MVSFPSAACGLGICTGTEYRRAYNKIYKEEMQEGKYLCTHLIYLGSWGGSVCRMDCIISVPTAVWAGAGLGVRPHGRGLGADQVSGSVLKPALSFAASHYYKYKQQFIFPGMSPEKSLLWCRVLRYPFGDGQGPPNSPSFLLRLGAWLGFARRWGSAKIQYLAAEPCILKVLQGWGMLIHTQTE